MKRGVRNSNHTPISSFLVIDILHSTMDKAVHDLYKEANDDQQKIITPNDGSSTSVETVGQNLVGQIATKPVTQADTESNPAIHPN
jgi:hypothetical protein